jgi:RNA polymerase-binding transcription factor DksA
MSDRSDSPADPQAERQPDRGLDLDSIERDLADVEVALARLDAGTYWTDEVTGDELPTDLLAANPTARRLA